MRLIDTHCHFDDPVFDADRQQLNARMASMGISDVIFPAISATSWPQLKSITDSAPHYHASYGLHPMFMEQHSNSHIQQLRQWLEQEQAVAVGECGLDFFIPDHDRAWQEALFIQHLHLARDFDLPLIIHARKSLDTILKHIRHIGGLRGVIHSFSGSQQQAEQLIAQGFYLGIGGTITYERAQRLRKVVSQIPETHLLLETDAPDQPDSQWRGKRNDPTRLPVIAGTLAELRRISIKEVAQITTSNALRLFGIS